jgi:ATP-binding cassette subfamily B protein
MRVSTLAKFWQAPKTYQLSLGGPFLVNMAWALNFVWQSGRGLAAANVALVVMQGMLPLAGLYLLKLVIDSVAAGLTGPHSAAAWERVGFLIGLAGGVALLELLCSAAVAWIGAAQSQRVTDQMYGILHAKSIELDLEYYENSQYYDTLHRTQQEAPFRPIRIFNGVLQLGQNAISLTAMIALMIFFHWSVPIFLVLAAIPGVLVRFRFAEKFYSWQRERTPLERQAWYFHWMITKDIHAKEIRLFGLGDLFEGRFRRLRKQLFQESLELATRRSIAELITQSGAIIGAFGLYAFLAFRALGGLISLGDLVMFYQALQRAQSYIKQFFGSIASLYEDNLFLSDLHELLSLKPKVIESGKAKPVRCPLTEGIVFDGVSFHYPGANKNILEGISLRIRPGEHVALVGENGAGKTTLIKLLCRLYDPTEGVITFDGTDIRDISIRDLRREISVIFQDYVRYQLSARENIWLADVQLPMDHPGITTASREAGAHEFITKLGHGYETKLGSWFEHGQEISIGEWQKIALARAFFRKAQILVLDEPTSSVDAQAEYDFFENFHKLAKGCTAILISHRLSTVKMVDRIYVVEGGRIAESGTHQELLYSRGRYAHLFETQAQYYR